jgi:hypothetical protein
MGQANASRIDELLKRASVASRSVSSKQTNARVLAVQTIREMERKIQHALDGDVLRGLSDIAAAARAPFHAARVRTEKGFGLDEFLPRDGREVLVLTKRGELAMAARGASTNAVTARAVRDDELQAQDVEAIARVVQSALERHIARAARTEANYDRIAGLSERLACAIGFVL